MSARVSIFVASFVFAVSLPISVVFAVEYFPSEPGPIFEYENGEVTITSDGNHFVRMTCAACYVGTSESFYVDSGGDVYQSMYGSWSQAAPDPEGHYFTPGLLYLDFPLVAGKSWSTTGEQRDLFGLLEGTVTLEVEVVGPRVVTVPAGQFEVIEVVLEYSGTAPLWSNMNRTLWLQPQLGPVNGLLAWSGVVNSSPQTWGAVKALYR